MSARRDEIRRRRQTALGAAAAAAALAGAWVGAGDGDDEPRRDPGVRAAAPSREAPRERAAPAPTDAAGGDAARSPTGAGRGDSAPSTATLMREAGQTIVLRFAGPTAPAWALRALRERRAAGVILFADNVRSRGHLRMLTRRLRAAAGGRTLVMTDQEGGDVRRIPWAAPRAPASRLRTAGAARDVARATARDLRAVGIDVNLAPVADVGTHPRSIMRERAFPGGAARVGPLVAATVRAYEAGGVRATAKHFPGLGRATANTDFAPATVGGAPELAPFRAAVGAGASLVMADHALHPAVDRARITSQSSRALQGLLRDTLRFRGACITDALEAQAVVRRSSLGTAALRSMRAGCDLLLTSVPASYLTVLRELVAAARRDPALRARLREARGRITPLLRRGAAAGGTSG